MANDKENFDGFGGDNVVGSQPKRLSLPKGFQGEAPPIFINNAVQAMASPTNSFGNVMVTQNTHNKQTAGCMCCKQDSYTPDYYAVASGPAKNDSKVMLSGQFTFKEKCGLCGFGRLIQPSCYEDQSTIGLKTKDGKDYLISAHGISNKRAIFKVEQGGVEVAMAVENGMSKCQLAKNLLCAGDFTDYPYELRDSSGKAVLTKRAEYTGCCKMVKLFVGCQCITCCNACGASCGPLLESCGVPHSCAVKCCNPDCGTKCCSCSSEKKEKVSTKCCGLCMPSGECNFCGYCGRTGSCWRTTEPVEECCKIGCCFIAAGECACFGLCGSAGPCAQTLGCCMPSFCGGSCCKGGCCATTSWLEPIKTDTDEWLGPKEDLSGDVVAKISHSMNVQYTQKYGCWRTEKTSDIYHSSVDMPSKLGKSYGEAEWLTLLGWLGFVWHAPYTETFY